MSSAYVKNSNVHADKHQPFIFVVMSSPSMINRVISIYYYEMPLEPLQDVDAWLILPRKHMSQTFFTCLLVHNTDYIG